MESEEDHDRFLRKNQALSRAWEIDRKDRYKEKVAKGEAKAEDTACYKCKKVRPCLKYPMLETGWHEGAVSVSNELVFLCEECSPKRKKGQNQMTQKQIKSMLRGARRGRI